jgi:hypothetical protein
VPLRAPRPGDQAVDVAGVATPLHPCRGSLGVSMNAPRSGRQARLDALRLMPAGWRTRPLDRRSKCELPCRNPNAIRRQINGLTLSTSNRGKTPGAQAVARSLTRSGRAGMSEVPATCRR